ncbi:MAG: hypothetical protein M1827_006409 [Pycnora praestabilis]|nr:MAG: hypothetical protein M1827_006409 [Pycnora praestabilis]
MSHFWPHGPYAEDQPYSRTILSIHVLQRGFETGAIIGFLAGSTRHLIQRRSMTSLFLPYIIRSTGVGAAIGIASMTVVLPLRMWGREDIEWRDRSWRLLENKGQVEVDSWSHAAAAVGALVGVANRGGGPGAGAAWKRVLGTTGLGSMVGVVGYMGWRYGIHGGKWSDDEGS